MAFQLSAGKVPVKALPASSLQGTKSKTKGQQQRETDVLFGGNAHGQMTLGLLLL
jgi:hypothetical protein